MRSGFFFRRAVFVFSLFCGAILSRPVSAAPGNSKTSNAPATLAAGRTADSLRHEAARLAGQGKLDQALDLVDRRAADLPAVWAAMFAGKLEIDGESAARGYLGASADSAPEQMRGEAIYRLGQYHYAAGRYHLAIPQFRAYLARFPEGGWSQESAYWMAHACVRLAQQRSDREAAEERPSVFLLSLQAEPHSPEAGAWEDSLRWNYPLSPEAGLLARGATGATDAPTEPPASAAVPVPVTVPIPVPHIPAHSTPPAPATPSARAHGSHTLQLGAFSQPENAERLRAELATKRIPARVEPLRSGNRTLFRVLAGNYPDAATAQQEGKKIFAPLGYAYRVVEQK